MVESVICECHSLSDIDIISLVVSALSLIAAGINLYLYRKLQKEYNSMVKTQTLTGQGELETQVRSAIAEAYQAWVNLAVMLAEKPGDEFLKRAVAGAEEIYRNAYEDACGKYNDSKINKTRFKLMYQAEIRQLVEEEPHRRYYSDRQSPYDATLKVYDEWYHPEKKSKD